jgi:hypothetical protein
MDPNATIPVPERQSPAPEVGGEQLSTQGLEVNQAPASAEASQNGPKADDGAAVAQAQIAAVTTDDPAQAVPVVDPADPATPPAPLTAADVDVIEPEWVKKAEKAVADNRDDPRAEESAVEAVQIEYLKKRYNIDVEPGDKAT